MTRIQRLQSNLKNNLIFQQIHEGRRRRQEQEQEQEQVLEQVQKQVQKQVQEQEKKTLNINLHAENNKQRFITTQNIISGCHLEIGPGIWSINFTFELSTDGKKGDGIHNNITYGISTDHQSFHLIKINDAYNLFHDDSTTYQSYYRSFVYDFTENTTIFLNAFLNNLFEEVDIFMKNISITAILLHT